MTDLDNNQPSAKAGASIGKNAETAGQGWLAAWESTALWSRIAVGFAALCCVKIIMLVTLRKQLFEIHWRVSEEQPTWLNSFAFYLFALLAGLNLWKLAVHCQAAGARVVRAANLCVLFLSALFIFLTFHEGDKNYLYAVMSDILGWKDLRWYLISNSCFRMPYLAVWLLAYGFIYYGLWRKKREHLMQYVTAVFAALYIAICLRDFREFRNALVIIDCLGIACLFLGAGSLNPFWLALPIVGAGSLFILFQPFQASLRLAYMNPQFSVLLWGYLILLLGVSLIAWRRGFLAGWARILPFVIAAFLLMNVNYPNYPNYENILCMGFMLPRYFLGEFGIMAALFVLAGCYRKLRPSGTLLWLDVVNLLLITLALADLRLTQIMAVRLDWDVFSLAAGETPKMMWRMSQPYLPSLALGLALIAIFYVLLIWAIRRTRSATPEGSPARGRSLTFAIVACVLLGVAGLSLAPGDKAEGQTVIRFAATSPLLKHSATPVMDQATFVKTATDLGLSGMLVPAPPVSARPQRDLNVVVIFQESTYNQHLSLFGSKEDTQPLLSRYKDRMEIFPNFFSVFAGSMNARFATFTGLYPVGDYHAFTAERVPVKSIFEALHDHGYTCSMFYSSFFDYTDFRDFLRKRGIDGMYDADTMPGERKGKPVSWGLQEEETLGAMRQYIKKHAADKQKFFMTYVPAAPHNPFDGTPQRFQKKKMDRVGDLAPFYFNELLYMDWIISSIVDELKESGLLDNTMIVITADHGEMLGENGGPVGHGWAMTPELANVPLIIMDPGHPGYRINDTIGSQVDVMPTILDALGIALPAGELYQGASLYSPDLNTNRMIFLNSFRQYGEVQGARFLRGDRETDQNGPNPREAFTIANEGPHTLFLPAPPVTNAPSIFAFDDFQKNLLRNYSVYRRMFAPAELPK
jgi:glucan phosphoethanolaminetransferase (alkaline phosphatase superfamily)